MQIRLIRHGKTSGNLRRCYLGRTDEPLCDEGREELLQQKNTGPAPDLVIISPMLRCRQTAEILFPGTEVLTQEKLKEIDFGSFEGKTWQELSGREDYQRWIDSGGLEDFPEGEGLQAFKKRCCEGFTESLRTTLEKGVRRPAFVVHGGSIMAVLEAFALPQKDYYDWQTGNGCGFRAEFDRKAFFKGERFLTVVENDTY